jgi:Phage integrase, N-terminal SAM-like domain
MTSLAPHMETFLREYLIRHRGASQHTCDSYAYSFQSLFEFAAGKLKVAPSDLMLEQLDATLVSGFLEYLETKRGNSAETRNIRLAAIRSFFRFLQHREPAGSPRSGDPLQEDRHSSGIASGPGGNAGFARRSRSIHAGGSPGSGYAAPRRVRWSPRLRTDRLAGRGRRAPVREYTHPWQGSPRAGVASLEDNGDSTPRLVGHPRSGRIARALCERPRRTIQPLGSRICSEASHRSSPPKMPDTTR